MITFKQYITESRFHANLQIWSGVTKSTEPFFKKHIDKLLSKFDKQSLPLFIEFAKEYFKKNDDNISHNLTWLVQDIDKSFSVDEAIDAITHWWYTLYELNYEYFMEDSNIQDPIKLRDYAISNIDELMMVAFNKFHNSKRFKVYKKQQQVKDIISKNNTTGWEL